MSQALINRSLTNVKTELEFLQESNVITKELYDKLIKTLPDKYTGQPAINSINDTQSISNDSLEKHYTNNTISSNIELAELIYDFQPQQESDLRLQKGDKITVTEKLNADWWKGQNGNLEGVFPSNYVKLLSTPSRQNSQYIPPQTPMVYHQQPQQQQQQQQPQFPPPSTNYYEQPQQQQPQEQHKKHHHLGRFGKQLKDALVFGAGATIGADIVNSIF